MALDVIHMALSSFEEAIGAYEREENGVKVFEADRLRAFARGQFLIIQEVMAGNIAPPSDLSRIFTLVFKQKDGKLKTSLPSGALLRALDEYTGGNFKAKQQILSTL